MNPGFGSALQAEYQSQCADKKYKNRHVGGNYKTKVLT